VRQTKRPSLPSAESSWIFREILGSGTFFGFPVVPQGAYDHGYVNMGLMVLAPGAFFVLGLLIWVQKSIMLARKGSHS